MADMENATPWRFVRRRLGGVLSGFVLAALLVAFFNPPEPGVISGEYEYVQRVVDGEIRWY